MQAFKAFAYPDSEQEVRMSDKKGAHQPHIDRHEQRKLKQTLVLILLVLEILQKIFDLLN